MTDAAKRGRSIVVAVRTVSGLNAREHWRKRARRVKGERAMVALSLLAVERPALPCTVLLTRQGPSNGLDDDNLSGALKGVRDEIASWLGVDDRLRDVVRYRYEQRRAKEWGVEIQFEAPVSPGTIETQGNRFPAVLGASA